MRNKLLLIPLLLLAAAPLYAQRKVSADVEVKTVIDGKLTTVTKSVYCSNNGRLVTKFSKPLPYYVVSNAKGEMNLYRPDTNEVLSDVDPALASNTEFIMLFMSGRIDDLGLTSFGYKAGAATREDGFVKKTFKSPDPNKPDVVVVYENYLPIYCEYTAQDGRLMSKKYLSDYKTYGRFVLPQRVTDITYGVKRDSSIVRTIYSSVKVDVDDPNFDFQIPADAKPMKLEAPAQ